MSDKRPSIILRLDVDYDRRFREICERNHRKMVDQVKVWVDAEEAGATPQVKRIDLDPDSAGGHEEVGQRGSHRKESPPPHRKAK